MLVDLVTRSDQKTNAKSVLVASYTMQHCKAHLSHVCPKTKDAVISGRRLVSKSGEGGAENLLANKENVDSTEVKIIKEWECRETIISRMLARIKLVMGVNTVHRERPSTTYHDCFALILDDMAGPANFITSA